MNHDRLYLSHILGCIQRIEQFTQMGRQRFLYDLMIQDAVIRNLEIIGEATKRLSESIRSEHSQVPWRQIAGLRDVLIHDYMGVDLDEVWYVVERDLPALQSTVQEILARSEQHD